MPIAPLDQNILIILNHYLSELEKHLDSDVMTIYSAMESDVDRRVRDALEMKDNKREKLTVVLDTFGGSVEIVERIVNTIRHHYTLLDYIVPGKAMSAGTVLVMSGDNIFMNYYSVLGPIDPQVPKDGKWVPALSFLRQFDKLVEKARNKELTTADAVLLEKFDPGELYQFERARDISVDLLKSWLSRYKFKDWKETETNKTVVTEDLKKQRAEDIAQKLNDIDRWHSHSRGINCKTICDELNLKIEDYSKDEEKSGKINSYFRLFEDYARQKNWDSLVHTLEFF